MKPRPGGCRLKGVPASRSARPSCEKCLCSWDRQFRPGFGRLSSAAWQRSRCSATSARAKCSQPWRRSRWVQLSPRSPLQIEAVLTPRSSTKCIPFTSGREIFSCWWGPQREPSCCARTLSAPVGRSAVLISTGTRFTRLRTMTATANTAYGPRRTAIGARSCAAATILERRGPTPGKLPFAFLRTPAFH